MILVVHRGECMCKEREREGPGLSWRRDSKAAQCGRVEGLSSCQPAPGVGATAAAAEYTTT